MIINYLADNFETMVKLAVGSLLALMIAVGFFAFVVICYVIIDDMKKRRKKDDREKSADRGSLS